MTPVKRLPRKHSQLLHFDLRLQIRSCSEGATIWFIKQLVKARAARCTYGIEVGTAYNNALHAERSTKAYLDNT
jgi:hypothetical protein